MARYSQGLQVKLRHAAQKTEGLTTDLSPTGLQICTDLPLLVGQDWEIELTLPGGQHLTGRAKVRWSRLLLNQEEERQLGVSVQRALCGFYFTQPMSAPYYHHLLS